ESLIKMNGRIDVFGELLQRIGGTRRERGGRGGGGRGGPQSARKPRGGAERNGNQTGGEKPVEMTICGKVDGIVGGGERGEGVIAQIESGDGGGIFGMPLGGALVAVFALADLGAGSGQAKFAGPMKSQIVLSECRIVPEMGIPAFAGADKEH